MRLLEKRLSTSQLIILGFAALILLGAALLMLPFASAGGKAASPLEALFTSTSAVCVTGLVVRDTALSWSPFGQAVILCLIQIGGMGVVTVAMAAFSAAGSRVSLKQRSTMQEALSAPQLGGIVKLGRFVIKMTALFELLGALALAPVFCGRFGVGKGLWYALFHSISAFCNAGFDLMGTEAPYSSLTGFAAQPVVNLTVMALIVVGGIGFLVWGDVKENRLHLKKYRMQTKVVLAASALLIALPAAYFFCVEFAALPLPERLWASLFQSVTARTAGFNTADLTAMSGVGQGMLILLMLVGGSPGSTAGGMKTTTLAVLLATALAVFRRREHTQFFGRRLEDGAVRQAVAVLAMYLVLFLAGGCVISRAEGLPLSVCLFETASAVGTVGLTLGITPTLSALSRVILILLMYFGRVGGLTLVFAALSGKRSAARLPQEWITVG